MLSNVKRKVLDYIPFGNRSSSPSKSSYGSQSTLDTSMGSRAAASVQDKTAPNQPPTHTRRSTASRPTHRPAQHESQPLPLSDYTPYPAEYPSFSSLTGHVHSSDTPSDTYFLSPYHCLVYDLSFQIPECFDALLAAHATTASPFDATQRPPHHSILSTRNVTAQGVFTTHSATHAAAERPLGEVVTVSREDSAAVTESEGASDGKGEVSISVTSEAPNSATAVPIAVYNGGETRGDRGVDVRGADDSEEGLNASTRARTGGEPQGEAEAKGGAVSQADVQTEVEREWEPEVGSVAGAHTQRRSNDSSGVAAVAAGVDATAQHDIEAALEREAEGGAERMRVAERAVEGEDAVEERRAGGDFSVTAGDAGGAGVHADSGTGIGGSQAMATTTAAAAAAVRTSPRDILAPTSVSATARNHGHITAATMPHAYATEIASSPPPPSSSSAAATPVPYTPPSTIIDALSPSTTTPATATPAVTAVTPSTSHPSLTSSLPRPCSSPSFTSPWLPSASPHAVLAAGLQRQPPAYHLLAMAVAMQHAATLPSEETSPSDETQERAKTLGNNQTLSSIGTLGNVETLASERNEWLGGDSDAAKQRHWQRQTGERASASTISPSSAPSATSSTTTPPPPPPLARLALARQRHARARLRAAVRAAAADAQPITFCAATACAHTAGVEAAGMAAAVDAFTDEASNTGVGMGNGSRVGESKGTGVGVEVEGLGAWGRIADAVCVVDAHDTSGDDNDSDDDCHINHCDHVQDGNHAYLSQSAPSSSLVPSLPATPQLPPHAARRLKQPLEPHHPSVLGRPPQSPQPTRPPLCHLSHVALLGVHGWKVLVGLVADNSGRDLSEGMIARAEWALAETLLNQAVLDAAAMARSRRDQRRRVLCGRGREWGMHEEARKEVKGSAGAAAEDARAAAAAVAAANGGGDIGYVYLENSAREACEVEVDVDVDAVVETAVLSAWHCVHCAQQVRAAAKSHRAVQQAAAVPATDASPSTASAVACMSPFASHTLPSLLHSSLPQHAAPPPRALPACYAFPCPATILSLLRLRVSRLPLFGYDTLRERVLRYTSAILPARVPLLAEASLVWVTAHSQGTVISAHLLAALLAAGVLDTRRQHVALHCVAGVLHGPFPDLPSDFMPATRELFRLGQPSSHDFSDALASLTAVLRAGVTCHATASWADAVVPLASALAGLCRAPRLTRALVLPLHGALGDMAADSATATVTATVRTRANASTSNAGRGSGAGRGQVGVERERRGDGGSISGITASEKSSENSRPPSSLFSPFALPSPPPSRAAAPRSMHLQLNVRCTPSIEGWTQAGVAAADVTLRSADAETLPNDSLPSGSAQRPGRHLSDAAQQTLSSTAPSTPLPPFLSAALQRPLARALLASSPFRVNTLAPALLLAPLQWLAWAAAETLTSCASEQLLRAAHTHPKKTSSKNSPRPWSSAAVRLDSLLADHRTRARSALRLLAMLSTAARGGLWSQSVLHSWVKDVNGPFLCAAEAVLAGMAVDAPYTCVGELAKEANCSKTTGDGDGVDGVDSGAGAGEGGAVGVWPQLQRPVATAEPWMGVGVDALRTAMREAGEKEREKQRQKELEKARKGERQRRQLLADVASSGAGADMNAKEHMSVDTGASSAAMTAQTALPTDTTASNTWSSPPALLGVATAAGLGPEVGAVAGAGTAANVNVDLDVGAADAQENISGSNPAECEYGYEDEHGYGYMCVWEDGTLRCNAAGCLPCRSGDRHRTTRRGVHRGRGDHQDDWHAHHRHNAAQPVCGTDEQPKSGTLGLASGSAGVDECQLANATGCTMENDAASDGVGARGRTSGHGETAADDDEAREVTQVTDRQREREGAAATLATPALPSSTATATASSPIPGARTPAPMPVAMSRDLPMRLHSPPVVAVPMLQLTCAAHTRVRGDASQRIDGTIQRTEDASQRMVATQRAADPEQWWSPVTVDVAAAEAVASTCAADAWSERESAHWHVLMWAELVREGRQGQVKQKRGGQGWAKEAVAADVGREREGTCACGAVRASTCVCEADVLGYAWVPGACNDTNIQPRARRHDAVVAATTSDNDKDDGEGDSDGGVDAMAAVGVLHPDPDANGRVMRQTGCVLSRAALLQLLRRIHAARRVVQRALRGEASSWNDDMCDTESVDSSGCGNGDGVFTARVLVGAGANQPTTHLHTHSRSNPSSCGGCAGEVNSAPEVAGVAMDGVRASGQWCLSARAGGWYTGVFRGHGEGEEEDRESARREKQSQRQRGTTGVSGGSSNSVVNGKGGRAKEHTTHTRTSNTTTTTTTDAPHAHTHTYTDTHAPSYAQGHVHGRTEGAYAWARALCILYQHLRCATIVAHTGLNTRPKTCTDTLVQVSANTSAAAPNPLNAGNAVDISKDTDGTRVNGDNSGTDNGTGTTSIKSIDFTDAISAAAHGGSTHTTSPYARPTSPRANTHAHTGDSRASKVNAVPQASPRKGNFARFSEKFGFPGFSNSGSRVRSPTATPTESPSASCSSLPSSTSSSTVVVLSPTSLTRLPTPVLHLPLPLPLSLLPSLLTPPPLPPLSTSSLPLLLALARLLARAARHVQVLLVRLWHAHRTQRLHTRAVAVAARLVRWNSHNLERSNGGHPEKPDKSGSGKIPGEDASPANPPPMLLRLASLLLSLTRVLLTPRTPVSPPPPPLPPAPSLLLHSRPFRANVSPTSTHARTLASSSSSTSARSAAPTWRLSPALFLAWLRDARPPAHVHAHLKSALLVRGALLSAAEDDCAREARERELCVDEPSHSYAYSHADAVARTLAASLPSRLTPAQAQYASLPTSHAAPGDVYADAGMRMEENTGVNMGARGSMAVATATGVGVGTWACDGDPSIVTDPHTHPSATTRTHRAPHSPAPAPINGPYASMDAAEVLWPTLMRALTAAAAHVLHSEKMALAWGEGVCDTLEAVCSERERESARARAAQELKEKEREREKATMRLWGDAVETEVAATPTWGAKGERVDGAAKVEKGPKEADAVLTAVLWRARMGLPEVSPRVLRTAVAEAEALGHAGSSDHTQTTTAVSAEAAEAAAAEVDVMQRASDSVDRGSGSGDHAYKHTSPTSPPAVSAVEGGTSSTPAAATGAGPLVGAVSPTATPERATAGHPHHTHTPATTTATTVSGVGGGWGFWRVLQRLWRPVSSSRAETVAGEEAVGRMRVGGTIVAPPAQIGVAPTEAGERNHGLHVANTAAADNTADAAHTLDRHAAVRAHHTPTALL